MTSRYMLAVVWLWNGSFCRW